MVARGDHRERRPIELLQNFKNDFHLKGSGARELQVDRAAFLKRQKRRQFRTCWNKHLESDTWDRSSASWPASTSYVNDVSWIYMPSNSTSLFHLFSFISFFSHSLSCSCSFFLFQINTVSLNTHTAWRKAFIAIHKSVFQVTLVSLAASGFKMLSWALLSSVFSFYTQDADHSAVQSRRFMTLTKKDVLFMVNNSNA